MDTLTRMKMLIFRVLKVTAYALGIPLMLYMLSRAVSAAGGYGLIAEGTKTAFSYIALGFVAVAVLQVIVGLSLKKFNFLIRALIVALAASAVVAVPLIYIEASLKPKAGAAEAAGYTAKLDRYYRDLNSFVGTYNLSSSNDGYNAGGNIEGSYSFGKDAGSSFLSGFEDFEHYTFGASIGNGGVYGANGLYSDGYIFGYDQASYILRTYHRIRAEYEKAGLDADKALLDALLSLDAADSVWSRYKNTAEFIGSAANSEKYSVSVQELKEKAEAIAGGISDTAAYAAVAALIDGANTVLGLGLPDEIKELLNNPGNMTYERLITAVESLNLEIGGRTLDEGLLLEYVEEYASYQSSTAYPKIFFIENESLREYAYAKYEGVKHGAFIGSVLIGDRVGAVSFGSSGSAPMSYSELEAVFSNIERTGESAPEYYPLFALRDALLKYAALIPAAIILAYYLAHLENKQFKKLLKGGTAK